VVLVLIPAIFQNAIYPVTSRCFTTSNKSLKFASERFLNYMIIIGIPIGIGTTLLANKIILLIFGAEYAPSVIALQVLIWGLVFAFIEYPFDNLLSSINRQSIIAAEVGIAAILNLIMNFLLIPKYSLVGASASMTATWIFEFLFVYILTSKIGYNISNKATLNLILKASASGLIMGVSILYFKVNLLIIVVLSSLIYFGVFYVIGGFDKYDTIIIKELISKPSRLHNRGNNEQ